MRIVKTTRVSIIHCTACGEDHDAREVFEVKMDATFLGPDAEFVADLRAFICPRNDYTIVLYRRSLIDIEVTRVEKV